MSGLATRRYCDLVYLLVAVRQEGDNLGLEHLIQKCCFDQTGAVLEYVLAKEIDWSDLDPRDC